MGQIWIDLTGPVLADTVYDEGKLVGRDVTISLPPVTSVTADFKAMGTITMPLPGMIDAMEASITKVGLDLGLRSLVKMDSKTLEFRWPQNIVCSDGTQKKVGCKAFLRVVSKGIPGLDIEPGNSASGETNFAVSRYQLFVDGEEYWLVDQLATIQRIDGVDYAEDIRNLL